MCSPVAHQRALWEGAFFGRVSLAQLGMAGSSGDAVQLVPASHLRQRAGAPWLQEVKNRMPRHQKEEAEKWILSREIPSAERWFHAQQWMEKQRRKGRMMRMAEAFDMIRRDLSTTRVAWYPQKWTTMVEGRPVQVQLCILPYKPQAEPDARRANDYKLGGAGRPPSKKKLLISETSMSEGIPIHVM